MTRYATSAPQRLVGWYLRDYRESAGYDLADAARVLGCSRSKISRVEAGQRGIPAKELCALLAGYGRRHRRGRAAPAGGRHRRLARPAQTPGRAGRAPQARHHPAAAVRFLPAARWRHGRLLRPSVRPCRRPRDRPRGRPGRRPVPHRPACRDRVPAGLRPPGGTRTQPGSQYRRAPQARRRPLRPRAAPLPAQAAGTAVPRRGGRQPGRNRKFLAMTSLIRKTNDHYHYAA